MEERIFGHKNDISFWSSKPIQKKTPRRQNPDSTHELEKKLQSLIEKVAKISDDQKIKEVTEMLRNAKNLLSDYFDENMTIQMKLIHFINEEIPKIAEECFKQINDEPWKQH